MKNLARIAAIALVTAAAYLGAQTPTITLNIPEAGFNCGRASSPLYCFGIPTKVNGVAEGSLWLDTYLTGTNAGTGFVLPSEVGDLEEAHVTGNSYVNGTFVSQGRTLTAPASVTVAFSGDTSSGGSYSGVMTLTFTYYYSAGGGGRGGAGAGWRFICTGGTLRISE